MLRKIYNIQPSKCLTLFEKKMCLIPKDLSFDMTKQELVP